MKTKSKVINNYNGTATINEKKKRKLMKKWENKKKKKPETQWYETVYDDIQLI